MLRYFAAVPALSLAPARALADGTSGSIGRGAVGAHELRDGDVPLNKLQSVEEGAVLGRAVDDGAGAPRELSDAELRRLVERSSTNLFAATRAEAETYLPSANLQTIVLLGQFAPGDGGGGVYIRAATEPSHLAKLQTSDGQWWENIEFEPTPLVFGARWDGSTDDTAAINDWAAFLRLSRKAGRLPPGTTYCAGTIYLGGCSVRGAGGPSNADTYASRTIIESNGNPMISMAPGVGEPQTLFYTNWEDFTVKARGDAVQPIELWDRLSYPYQIGLWLGRSHLFMQRTTDASPETAASGGAGGITMRGVAVQDASGWGVYCYKFWGKSVVDDVFIRRCGGRAAYELGDDRLGGAINLAGVSVDFTFSNIHAYAEGHSNPLWNRRGTGLRLGARKNETDALNRLWEPGGNQKFESVFLERHAIGIAAEATSSAMFEHFSISADEIRLGHPSNPSGNLRVSFGKWRSFGLSTITITQSSQVDLGQYLNQDVATTTEIRYATGFSWSPPGRGADVVGIYDSPTILTPYNETANGQRSIYQFVPFASVDFDQGDVLSNRLPGFGTAGGALTGWVHNGVGTIAVDAPWKLRLRNSAYVYYDVTGLEPGTLCTLQWWMELPGAVNLQDVEFAVGNSSNQDIIRRALGNGTKTKDLHWRALNAVAPANGILRFSIKGKSANDVILWHPLLTLGACRPMGPYKLSIWPAADGIRVVA